MNATTGTVLDIHHEIHGAPSPGTAPLLLIHGGGSTIGTNWAAILPALTATRQVIAVELQGHGRTPPTTRPASFENSADDVAAVLRRLSIGPVDVLGFSNGGSVAMRLAMRHRDLVRRQIVASSHFRREGMVDGFWDGMQNADLRHMPQVYQDADRALNPDPAHLEELFRLDSQQMLTFVDWPDDHLRAMSVPTLFVCGDRDVIRVEHVVEMARLTPGARLLVVPGTHGDYLGEVFAADGDTSGMHRTLPWLLDFLDATTPTTDDGA
jgi:pimeloyl-ACP methyl ester carboxylesterase